MKAVIEGRLYDTKTAEAVAEHSSPHYADDFYSYEETLYRTVNGRWFLAGSGNCKSPYGEPCEGGRMGSGKGIRLLEKEEALDWCERHDVPARVICTFFAITDG